jgi:hypothetical protein
MMTGDGGVEFADLLVQAFLEVSVGVADREPDLIYDRSPTGTAVQACLTRTARV